MTTALQVRGKPGYEPMEGPRPFPGLLSWEDDSERLFIDPCGRGARVLREIVRQRSMPTKLRVVHVVGPTGCGITSLVQAGVFSQLQANHWRTLTWQASANPLAGLAMALWEFSSFRSTDPQAFVQEMAARDECLSETIESGMKEAAPELGVVIYVDLDELADFCGQPEARAPLLANLLHAAALEGGRTVLLLRSRPEGDEAWCDDPQLAKAICDRHVELPPLSSGGSLRVGRPAGRQGVV